MTATASVKFRRLNGVEFGLWKLQIEFQQSTLEFNKTPRSLRGVDLPGKSIWTSSATTQGRGVHRVNRLKQGARKNTAIGEKTLDVRDPGPAILLNRHMKCAIGLICPNVGLQSGLSSTAHALISYHREKS